MMEPIHDADAEVAVLSVCLLSGVLAEVLATEEGLRPEHFYREAHRRTYTAMLALADEGVGPDVIGVARRLERDGGNQPDSIKWQTWLDRIAGSGAAVAASRGYARTVIDAWTWNRRRLAHVNALVAVEARDDGALIAAEQAADALVASQSGEHLHDPADLATHMVEWLNTPRPPGMPMPWPEVQTKLKLRPGHTTVLAGWTNGGKTCAAGQLAAHVGRKGGKVVLWITEMTREEHVARELTRTLGIPYNAIIDGKLTEPDLARIVDALSRLPFGVIEAHGWPASQIARHLRQIRPDFAVVDHFHAMPNVAKTADADDAVQQLVTGAARANCHLLLVAQLNQGRNVGAARPTPVLRDLRGTGNLANLPSNVLLVHRDEEELFDSEGRTTGRSAMGENGHLDIAKQRGGQLGIVPVHFDADRLHFLEEAVA